MRIDASCSREVLAEYTERSQNHGASIRRVEHFRIIVTERLSHVQHDEPQVMLSMVHERTDCFRSTAIIFSGMYEFPTAQHVQKFLTAVHRWRQHTCTDGHDDNSALSGARCVRPMQTQSLKHLARVDRVKPSDRACSVQMLQKALKMAKY